MPEIQHEKAEALRAAGKCAEAASLLEEAIVRGHLSSRADLADMLMQGRGGVAQDCARAFVLLEEGAGLGCHNCQGMLAFCLLEGVGCAQEARITQIALTNDGELHADGEADADSAEEPRCLAMARASAAKGSKHGQWTLARFYYRGEGGVAMDYDAGVALWRLAAAQGYDRAQDDLGSHFQCAEEDAEALVWFMRAAAQGHGRALYMVGVFYENGYSVAADEVEAMRWYKCAAEAGWSDAADSLMRLEASVN